MNKCQFSRRDTLGCELERRSRKRQAANHVETIWGSDNAQKNAKKISVFLRSNKSKSRRVWGRGERRGRGKQTNTHAHTLGETIIDTYKYWKKIMQVKGTREQRSWHAQTSQSTIVAQKKHTKKAKRTNHHFKKRGKRNKRIRL